MKSRVFVGSSSESLDVAYAVQQNLEADVDVTVWTQGVFALSQTTMDGLIRQGSEVDFAVFVLSPDDVTKLRGREHPTARDNVIFEIGIFVGRLGMSRTFLLVAEGSDAHAREQEVLARWGEWGPAARHFHFATRTPRGTRHLSFDQDAAATILEACDKAQSIRDKDPDATDKNIPNPTTTHSLQK